jgi:hypothetical protein
MKTVEPYLRVQMLTEYVKLRCQLLGKTGRFIMYSGITKIYYKKTAGHVITKPVQIETTTQTFFSPQ